jgi:hypothetical protein
MKNIITFIVSWTLLIGGVSAQHYVIDYKYTNDSKRITQLEEISFRDTLTNTVVKKVSILALNPFGDLPYPTHEKASQIEGYKVYDLTGKTLKEVVPERVMKLYHYNDPSAIKVTRGQYFIDNKQMPDKAIVKFTFAVGNDSAKLVEYSDLYIYKADGSEIFSLKNNESNILNVDVDPSGRYLFYTYGLRWSGVSLSVGGVKIIDLAENHPVMEFPGEEVTIRFLNDHILYMFYNGILRDQKPDRWLKVLDFKKMKAFTHCYTFNEMMTIKTIQENGISYKNGDFDYYLPKFTVEDLQWKSYFIKGSYIEYQYDSDSILGEVTRTVIFRKTGELQPIKKLDVTEMSPFKDLPYRKVDSAGRNIMFYDLGNVAPKKMLPALVYKNYAPLFNKDDVLKSGRASATCSGDEKYAVCIYSLAVGIQYENIASYSKIFVYDAEGRQVLRYDDADGFIWDARFDGDRQYLCYRFAIGNTDTILKAGYRIWDFANPGYSLEVPLENAACQFVAPGLLCFYSDAVLPGNVHGTALQVIDLKENKSYKKSYDDETLKNIDLYTKEGIVFNNNKTDYFKKDFEGEGLSWKKTVTNGK